MKASMQDVVGWDVATWTRALEFWLRTTRVDLKGARVLEVGAGPGGVSLWLSELGAEVLCTDQVSVEAPRALHARHGLQSGITYRTLDIADWPAEVRGFDVIVAKSVTGMLGVGQLSKQRAAIGSIIEALNPGGEYWFADNLVGSPLHRVLRRAFVPWHDIWHYYTIDELQSLFASPVEVSIDRFGLLGAFGRTERQRSALARLERAMGLEKFLPATWRYVAAGVARKPSD